MCIGRDEVVEALTKDRVIKATVKRLGVSLSCAIEKLYALT